MKSPAVLLAVMAIGVAGCAGSQPRATSGVAPPPSPAAKRLFASAILRQASEWGDPHPTNAMVVPTTRRGALRIQFGQSGTSATPETPAYLVVAHGHFVAGDAPRPPGAASPRGTTLTLTFDAATNRSLEVGLLRKAHPLDRVGKPEPLPLGDPPPRAVASVRLGGPSLSRAAATKRLAGLLGAKPEQVQLVWADVATRSVELEWTAYAPHARLHVIGGPIGATVPRYFQGPAEAWLGAGGEGPVGVGSVRPERGHRILPRRSTSIPVSLVHALWRSHIRIRLAPLRPSPTVSRVRALRTLRPDMWEERVKPQRIWLVLIRHDARTWLAWMAVGHGVGPAEKCPSGSHGCPPRIRGRAVELLNATSGNGMMLTGF